MTKVLLSILLGWSVLACAESKSVPASKASPQEATPEQDRGAVEALRRRALDRKGLERVPKDADSPPVTGEVPDDLLASVFEDLEERSGGSRSDFNVMRGESVQWDDGSLGCPETGQDYQPVPVNGFWIVIAYRGIEYDYRASERGFYSLCESPGLEVRK